MQLQKIVRFQKPEVKDYIQTIRTRRQEVKMGDRNHQMDEKSPQNMRSHTIHFITTQGVSSQLKFH